MERETLDRRDGRSLFGQDPAGYDAARPGHPKRVYDILVERCGLRQGTAVLEIGPGTGQATRRLLELGADPLVAVEPDPALAEFLAHATGGRVDDRGLARSRKRSSRPDAFDLAAAASSFHWVDEPVGLAKIVASLRPGGWWAMWWTLFGEPGRRGRLHGRRRPSLRGSSEQPVGRQRLRTTVVRARCLRAPRCPCAGGLPEPQPRADHVALLVGHRRDPWTLWDVLPDPQPRRRATRGAPGRGRAGRRARVRRARRARCSRRRCTRRASPSDASRSYNPNVASDTTSRTMLPVHEAPTCSVAGAAEIVGSKWTVLIVHDLSEGPQALHRARALVRRDQPADARRAAPLARVRGDRRSARAIRSHRHASSTR